MKRFVSFGLVVAIVAVGCWFVQAGSLEPPGAPAPTMKTLDTIEPGTPIRASDLPKAITQSGNYYLVEDITTAGGGITIQSDDVTLDLKGFTLAGGTGDGISGTGYNNIKIKNGTVRGWSGIGVFVDSATVIEMVAETNGFDGFRIGDDSLIVDSIARNNTNGDGINAGSNVRISNCSTVGHFRGIVAGSGSVVTDSVASDSDVYGFEAFGATLDHCSAHNNDIGFEVGNSTLQNCTAVENTSKGFDIWPGAYLTDCRASGNSVGFEIVAGNLERCSATGNTGEGFLVASRHSALIGNHSTGNGTGIAVFDTDNVIEGNVVSNNIKGFDITEWENLIISNRAIANTTNYDIVGGNNVGAIVTTETAMNSATNALVNIDLREGF